MSPRGSWSGKWSAQPPRDPSRQFVYLPEAARRLGFTRPGVERAIQRGDLEGCVVTERERRRIAVYVDSLHGFTPRRASRRARAQPDASPVDRPVPPASAESAGHAVGYDPLRVLVGLVESIERYEEATRLGIAAQSRIEDAFRQLDLSRKERGLAIGILRRLSADTMMPDSVEAFLFRAGLD